MNREDFMRQLEALLYSVSDAEREEALQYYNDYFDDAGMENESDVIRALGSPAKVAETIKADLGDRAQYEFTDSGFQNSKEARVNEVMIKSDDFKEEEKEKAYDDQNKNAKTYKNSSNIILIVLIAILLFPLWVPIAGALFGVVVSILAALFAIFLSAAICSVVFIIVSIVLLVVALLKCFIMPIGSICLIGLSLVFAGLGILGFILTGFLCTKVIPCMVRGVVSICRIPFRRREGHAA